MPGDFSQEETLIEKITVYVIGFFTVGLLFGGIYSLPAMHITKSKEPWYTLLLAVGLTITVSVMGFLLIASSQHVFYAILIVISLLLVRRFFVKLDHNIERFGMLHALCLVGIFYYAFFFYR